MIQYVLLFALIFYSLNKNNKIVEGTQNTICCGNLKQEFIDMNAANDNPPEAVKRCFKGDYPYPKNPCKSAGSCHEACDGGGDSKCVPTTKGGYCNTNEGKKIYKNGEFESIGDTKIGRGLSRNTRAARRYRRRYSRKSDPWSHRRDSEDDDEDDEDGDEDDYEERRHRRQRRHRRHREEEEEEEEEEEPQESTFHILTKVLAFSMVVISIGAISYKYRDKIKEKLKGIPIINKLLKTKGNGNGNGNGNKPAVEK